MKFLNQKGQGALEYLLIIGGALVIAAVVVTVLSSSGTAGGNTAKTSSQSAICSTKADQKTCVMALDGFGCTWSTVNNSCTAPAACDQVGKVYNGTTYAETGVDGTDNLSLAQRNIVCASGRVPSTFTCASPITAGTC